MRTVLTNNARVLVCGNSCSMDGIKWANYDGFADEIDVPMTDRERMDCAEFSQSISRKYASLSSKAMQ